MILAAIAAGCRPDLSVDLSKIVTDTNAAPVKLAAEVTRANAQHKLLLMEFGSSDSCLPCVVFQQHVFSTPQFAAYEKSNLVFVRLDYPLKVKLRPETEATNNLLAHQFDAYAFPTFVALDKDGKPFWQMPGKNDPNPEIDIRLFQPKNFMKLLNSLREKQK
jgi:thioredoxin-related protein